jgi:hypothetical protein
MVATIVVKHGLDYDSIFWSEAVRFGVRTVYQTGIVLYEPLLRARVALHALPRRCLFKPG